MSDDIRQPAERIPASHGRERHLGAEDGDEAESAGAGPVDVEADAGAGDPGATAEDDGAAAEAWSATPPRGVALLRAIDNGFGTAEQGLLVVLLLLLIAVGATTAIATRFGTSFSGSKELIQYSVFFIAMAGAALSAHTEQLIAMDFVTRLLKPHRRMVLRLCLRGFTIAMCALLVAGGIGLSRETGGETGHFIPPAVGLLAIPIGAGLIGFHVLLHLVIDILYLAAGRIPPDRNRTAVH